MEILSGNIQSILDHVDTPDAESSLWRLLHIFMSDEQVRHSISHIAARLQSNLKEMSGKIVICNSREILMLIKFGRDVDEANINARSAASCRITISVHIWSKRRL